MISADEVVLINVGGTLFQTHLSTLRRHSGTVLAMWFQPPFGLPRDPRDGSYFIDRTPEVFGYILDYLRTGALTVPRDPILYTVLRREVHFYGLPISSQLPMVRPLSWEASPVKYLHARIVQDEMEKHVEWEEGALPLNFASKTVFEMVSYLSSLGYRVVSEYTSRGSRGYQSLWLEKKVLVPGTDVAVEVRDPGTL